MSELVTFLIGSLAAYRVARFIMLDSLIEMPRRRVYRWLESHPGRVTAKLLELLECPYCMTIWTAAGIIAVIDVLTSVSVPMPLIQIPAWSAGALVAWVIIEGAGDDAAEGDSES